MSTLIWDAVADRFYEAGVSKGVLYNEDGVGVAWNGITSVDENDANEVEPIFYDGVKISDVVTIGDFSATLKAFTYPDEFLVCEGIFEDQTGVYITNQPQEQFCLSYQTKIGNPITGTELGYKIHILYNLTAIPSSKTYETLSLDTEPVEFEWELSSIPEEIENYRPTAYVVIDSRKVNPDILQNVEDVLYGTESTDPHLPTLQSVLALINTPLEV